MALHSTLPNLLAFCAAFELGSFTKAATRLGVTPQAASRSVLRLEETLSTTLFRRTTRAITPTDAARVYYTTAKRALEMLEHAEQELSWKDAEQQGGVRISAPTSYAHHRLLPRLGHFRRRYPGIELEVHVGNRNVEFDKEGFDIAIRMGRIRMPGLVAKKLGDFELGVYAAPTYLTREGEPKTLTDLEQHCCIAFVMPSTGRVLPWSLAQARSWVPRKQVRCAEDVLATLSLARAGLGITQAYDILAEEDVRRGTLVQLLTDQRGASRSFSLIFPRHPKPSPAARALIDFLTEQRS